MSTALRRAWIVLVAAMVMACASAAEAGVIAAGKEWRQLTETTNFTRDEVATVCSTDGVAPCAGSLGGVSFDGWIWATLDQVGDLFRWYEPAFPVTQPASISGQPTSWAPAFFADFDPTSASPGMFNRAYGWSSTLRGTSEGYLPMVEDNFDPWYLDSMRTDVHVSTATTHPAYGVWAWRALPEPATLALVAIGLAVAGGRRRPPQPARADAQA